MQEGSSIAVDKGFKGTKLTPYKDSSISYRKERRTLKQFMVKLADIGMIIFGLVILVSAFWQPLFRDLLLDWLKYILENN
jgi:hypothetical protein